MSFTKYRSVLFKNIRKINESQAFKKIQTEAEKQYSRVKDNTYKGINYAGQYTQQKVKDGANYTAEQSYQAFKKAQAHLSLSKRIAGMFKFMFNSIRNTKLYRMAKYSLIMGSMAKGGYIYSTNFTKEITVSKSFHRYTNRGNNDYLIADEHHNLYRVSESLWFWQWWPTELWSSMKEGQKYHIVGYGIRIRKLGIYPNIVRVNNPIDEKHR